MKDASGAKSKSARKVHAKTRRRHDEESALPEPRPITVRLSRETFATLKARAGEERGEGLPSLSQVAIERYMEVCRRELSTVTLDETNWSLLRDAWSSTEFTADAIAYIDAQIADAIHLDGLAKKWDVDGEQLVATVRAWSYAQRVAVVDEVERLQRRAGTSST